VSTEAAVPVVTELVSRAWAMPGRTPPSRPAVATVVRHSRTHRRRRCRPMRVKNSLPPNDLSGSCTHRPPRTVRPHAFPLGRMYPVRGRLQTRSLGVVRTRRSRLEQWVKPHVTRTAGG
jgi:hypothetical protein